MELVKDEDLEAVTVTQVETGADELFQPEGTKKPETDGVTGEESTEVKADEGDVTPEPAYTDEEFDALHINDIDESRLTATQKKYFLKAKDLEKGYNRKYEALATERKQYETLQQQAVRTQQQTQYRDIYEAFDNDPKTVLQNLRTVLAQKKSEDPFSEEVIKLEGLRDELMERRLYNQEQQSEVAKVSAYVNQEILRTIPDFETKAPELTKFATEELGFNINEIQFLTDPAKMGPMASKITIAVNKLFDIRNAEKGLKSKEVKAKAPKTEKTGSGLVQPKEKTHTTEDYFALRRKQSA